MDHYIYLIDLALMLSTREVPDDVSLHYLTDPHHPPTIYGRIAIAAWSSRQVIETIVVALPIYRSH